MINIRLCTLVLVSVTFCLAGLPKGALGQEADRQLVDRYTGLMNQLRTELTAKIPSPGNDTQVQPLLASDALDAKLVTFAVLNEGTPAGLAAFAQQGKEQQRLIEQLLADPVLMEQMLVADGATGGKYGEAMKIYTDIQKASEKAKEGVFQRLAVALALEYAAPEFDHDPVKRYQHYEKAYLDGELDAEFQTLDTWSLRFVVNGNEPDWMLTWGREMLRNYRPDHVLTGNFGWRYTGLVRSNVLYGSTRQNQDRPELHHYQNIIMNGGICGRRAFVGQYITRCFGIPSIKRPSKAHGAMARWTPKGWIVNLGPQWGSGGTDTIYGRDRSFLASSQARRIPEAYLQVKRAMWIGDLLGEARQYGGEAKAGTWSGVSLLTQQRIIKESKAVTLAPLGEELGEADEPTQAEEVMAVAASEEDKKVINHSDGSIEIPTAAFSTPPKELKGVSIMKSFAGGQQAYFTHFMRGGGRPVYRGGSWKAGAFDCSSENRLREGGLGGYPNWGFRVAMTPKSGQTASEVTVDLGNGVTMEFVYIKPGKFIMGGEVTEAKGQFACINTPKHEVTITKGYYLGKYEVTLAQYGFGGKDVKNANHPKGGMRTDDAIRFCKAASQKAGQEVRLPTEAEWEYAARAGSDGRWFFGNEPEKLGEYAWFGDNAEKKSHPVGQKKPNPWGLYDIYGNVSETVADGYKPEYYANSPKTDPAGPSHGRQCLIEYTINVQQAGEYALTAKVVTMNYDQMLQVAPNDDTVGVRINLPFTCGSWKDSEPVVVTLKKGENNLNFWRADGPQFGIAVKSFTLKPTK